MCFLAEKASSGSDGGRAIRLGVDGIVQRGEGNTEIKGIILSICIYFFYLDLSVVSFIKSFF